MNNYGDAAPSLIAYSSTHVASSWTNVIVVDRLVVVANAFKNPVGSTQLIEVTLARQDFFFKKNPVMLRLLFILIRKAVACSLNPPNNMLSHSV